MSLFSNHNYLTNVFFICLLNSSLFGYYIKNFINNTVSFQINDARQLPVIIPNNNQLEKFDKIFNTAFDIKKQQFAQIISDEKANKLLDSIENNLDNLVNELYNI